MIHPNGTARYFFRYVYQIKVCHLFGQSLGQSFFSNFPDVYRLIVFLNELRWLDNTFTNTGAAINNICQKAVVFYDGGCPICSREIAHYQRRRGAEAILWIDITQQADSLTQYGLDYETAMRRFHVLDSNNNFQIGAFGFIYLWSLLKPYNFLAKMINITHSASLLDRLYEWFARRRQRGQCNETTCR